MQDSIVEQGVDLMLYGMGTVVVFLAILVISTLLMSWAIRRFFPEEEAPPAASPAIAAVSHGADARLLAVIKAALDQHRSRRD